MALNNEQLDALRELGNIGAGNAAVALSQLLGKEVLIDVPSVRLLELARLSDSEFMPDSGEVSIIASLKILGAVRGLMLVLFSQENALSLVNLLAQKETGGKESFSLLDTSMLSESAHILSTSYLNAIGEFLKIYGLVSSLSEITVDRIKGLRSFLAERFMPSSGSYILPIENHLVIDEKKVELLVVFLLEYESVRKILNIIGL